MGSSLTYAVYELVVEGVLHQQASPCAAALARVHVDALQGGGHRLLKVAVRKHDVGTLAA